MEEVLVMSLPVVRVTPIDTMVIKAAVFHVVNTITEDCIVFVKNGNSLCQEGDQPFDRLIGRLSTKSKLTILMTPLGY
jgi:hypothetical protein